MARTSLTRFQSMGASGGPRYRGRKRIVEAKLTREEIVQALWILVIAVIVIAGAMYLGWCTLQEELKSSETSSENNQAHTEH
jgi:hypothetical protein